VVILAPRPRSLPLTGRDSEAKIARLPKPGRLRDSLAPTQPANPGQFARLSGTVCKRRNAWWGREDSNLQLDGRISVTVTLGGPLSALTAKAATLAIPIVFHRGADAVELGVVASLGKPSDITGATMLAIALEAKRRRDAVPFHAVRHHSNASFDRGAAFEMPASRQHLIDVELVELLAHCDGHG
jgi:hypothetical protein